MAAMLRETRKHSDWPLLAKIAPHLHKFTQCTTHAIGLAPLKMNGKHVVASLQCKGTVSVGLYGLGLDYMG